MKSALAIVPLAFLLLPTLAIAQGAQAAPEPDYVLTPAGWRHQSCVHEVPDDAEIFPETGRIVVKRGKKTIKILGKCQYKPIPSGGAIDKAMSTMRAQTADVQAPQTDGWTLSSQVNGAPHSGGFQTDFAKITGSWYVPNLPTLSSDQILFFFNGLLSPQYIVQPVLQWGFNGSAGSGAFWVMANWFVSADDSIMVHSPFRRVHPNDLITGTVNATTCLGVRGCRWAISYQINGGQVYRTESGFTLPHGFQRAIRGAMENYDIDSCRELPQDGFAVFTGTKLFRNAYPDLAARVDVSRMTWHETFWLSNPNPNCNYDIQSDPSNGPTVVFTWSTQ